MNWPGPTRSIRCGVLPRFQCGLHWRRRAFFAVIVLITLLRAEKSVANGALTVITLLAVGIALAATIRGFGLSGTSPGGKRRTVNERGQPAGARLIDDLAGEKQF